MWLSASGILVLFLYVNPTVSRDACSDGMIKDAILSLARIIRDNSQKVERHEAREHRLSESIRKAVEDLTKKMSGVDTYAAHFSKIEERISEIEQLISQRDERERIQMQKTADSIENLETRLEAQLGEIKNTISEGNQHAKRTESTKATESVSASDIISRINDTEAHLIKKVDQIDSSLQTMVSNNKEERDEKERNQNEETAKLIENLESRLNTQLDEIKSSINPPSSPIECASASDIVSIINDSKADILGKVAKVESSLNTTANKNAHEAVSQVDKLRTIFNERNTNESIQNEKTEKLIKDSESRLETRLDEIKSTIDVILQTPTPRTIECATASDIVSVLNDTETHFVEKVAKLESSLAARDANESIQNQKTEKLIEDSESRIKTRLDEIKSTIDGIVETTPTIECASTSDIASMLNDTEAYLLEKVAQIESNLNTMAVNNANETTKQAEKLQTIFDERDVKEKTQNEKTEELIENMANRLQARLNEVDDNIVTEVRNVGSRLGDIASSLEKVQQVVNKEAEKPEVPIVDIGAIFEAETRALGNITEFIENILNRIQDLPTTSELQALHNETQAALQEAKHTLQSAVGDKINGMINSLDENNREIKHSVESLRSDLANNTQHLNKELHNLTSGQAITMRTAQEVLDTKRSVEFGFVRMHSELRESLKNQGAAINETLNKKIDGVSNDILENHSKAIANLTSKIEEELNQVWRQITAMYQGMTENAAILQKLNQQNEAYVNGTTFILDGMETKIGGITERMADISENLNYLLGPLSLITQQFNQVKTGFGAALDEIKASFKEVEEKANGLSHPGRHRIPHDYRGDEENSNIFTTPDNVIKAA